MEKLNVKKVANTFALTSAVIYLLCIILFKTTPTFSLVLGNYLFHSIELNSILVQRSLGFLVISLILGTIAGWLLGGLVALIYNKLK